MSVESQVMTQEGKLSGKVGKHKLLTGEFATLAAAGANIDSKVCFVNFAGNSHNLNAFAVQIQPVGTSDGFSSHWPEWAYSIAKDAFLYNKKVWVIYEGGTPWGDKLLQVHLVN